MHFPKFWAFGRNGKYCCWRSSDTSEADARAKAEAAAQVIGQRLEGGQRWAYGYPDREVREEVLQAAPGQGAEPAWAVTRNAYGCDVLNTARVVFVDVDHDGPADPHLRRAEAWALAHPGWAFRAYRTKAGMRLLATNALVAPDAPIVLKDLFPAMRTDELYARLCRTQRSFRARLTPKPWRIKAPTLRQRWPWRDARAESLFRRWQARYQELAQAFATCELIAEVGPTIVHPEIVPLIALHDRVTRVGSGLPLA